MTSLLTFREQEYQKYLAADITNAGTYTSVNLNIMNVSCLSIYWPCIFICCIGTMLRAQRKISERTKILEDFLKILFSLKLRSVMCSEKLDYVR